MSALLAAALDYAARGLPVFPCAPRAKLPAIRKNPAARPGWQGRGVSDATCDPDLIRAWWRWAPAANIGLACGHGVWVVDVDGPEAAGVLASRAARARTGLPQTATVETRGGFHLYWQGEGPPKNGAPARVRCLPGQRAAGPDGYLRPAGFDTRVRGGYVLAPPSIHPSGAVYDWLVSLDGQVLDLSVLAPAPDWLVEMLTPWPASPVTPPRAAATPRRRAQAGDGSRVERAVQAILAKHCDLVYGAPPGMRHAQLRDSALRIGGLVKNGWLGFQEAWTALERAGRDGYVDKGGVWDQGRKETLRWGLENGTAWSPEEAEERG